VAHVDVWGQCTLCSGTASGIGAVSVGGSANGVESGAFGALAGAWGEESFAIGTANAGSSSAYADGAFAIGIKSFALGDNSISIGHWVETDASASSSYAFGSGITGSNLVNDISNSIMLGMNSDVPTLFVEGAAGTSGSIGKVGLGLTAPDALLHVEAASAGTEEIARFSVAGVNNDNNHFQIKNESPDANEFGIMLKAKNSTHSDRATLMIKAVADNDPQVAIMQFDSRYTGAASGDGYKPLFVWTENNNGNAKMIMDGGGNVGIGTNNPTALLTIGADDACKPSTPTWQICSDLNLKTDVSEFEDGLEVLTQINPVWFRYNGVGYLPTEDLSVGIIAQEIQQIAPYMIEESEIVVDTSSMEMMPVLKYNANALFYILVNSVQELEQRTNDIGEMNVQMQTMTNSYEQLQQQYNELSQIIQECCSVSEPSYRFGTEDSDDLNTTKSDLNVVPNPFRGSAVISYNLENDASEADLKIVDSNGQLVYSVPLQGMKGSLTITSNDLGAGTYYCSLVSGNSSISTTKMIHVK
jgi:hypothetical protein